MRRILVFEEGNLGTGFPFSRFIVEAGHPVCSQEAYNNNENKGLKPAKEYVNDGNIIMTTWDEAAKLLEGDNRRYDIIMPEDSCGVYIANEVVVQSRQSRLKAGYSWD